LKETFSHKVSKEPSRKKARSTVTTAKQLTEIVRKEGVGVKKKGSVKGGKGSNLPFLEL
jgi:hypothetical protein